MVAPIVLALLFLIALALAWALTLAETALDYLSYREAEAIAVQQPKTRSATSWIVRPNIDWLPGFGIS